MTRRCLLFPDILSLHYQPDHNPVFWVCHTLYTYHTAQAASLAREPARGTFRRIWCFTAAKGRRVWRQPNHFVKQTSLRARTHNTAFNDETYVETEPGTKLEGLICEAKSEDEILSACNGKTGCAGTGGYIALASGIPSSQPSCMLFRLYPACVPKTVIYTSSGSTATFTASPTPYIGPVI